MTKEFKFNIDVKYVRYEREEHSFTCETEAQAIELAKQYVSGMRKEFSDGEYVEDITISDSNGDYIEDVMVEGDIVG
jgi:hypothetical protein